MFLNLLKLEWKSFFRSANAGKSIAIKLFMGFIGLYFLIVFLLLGIGLYAASEKLFPNEEPILIINNYLLYWLAFEFCLRFLLQNLPVIKIKPLLTQRISKSRIVHVLLFKSVFSFYNILALAVAIPFAIVNLNNSSYSFLALFGWLLGLLGFVFTLNFFNLWVQRRFSTNLKALVPFVLLCTVLVVLEHYSIFSVSELFGGFFDLVLAYPILGALPVVLVILSYWLSFRDIKSNLYLDSYLDSKQKTYQASDLSWTNRFGDLSPFIQLDLKLLWRNKRAKTAVYVSLGFLAYGLMFYTNPMYANSSMLIFVGIFMTGIFIINFGQFIPAWDSSYFPLLQTRPITMKTYLEAKAMLMYISILILTVLSTAYIYFGSEIVYINVACAIYNAGINVPILLCFGAFNKKYIDLSNGNMFNYQGIGAAQWLVGLPIIIIPLVIWFVVKTFGDQNTANLVLIGIGLIGLILRKVIINGLVELYLANRFKMLEGFKQRG
ncbi:DUF5687 family protein [Sphingobacterium bovistauri]|uniref:ABC-2 type transport system permease protein n=1 Tax=Sphingobacterium bovistauri TaxID=2781959 RepID=A0ABS7Z908_9SPHI|nr:DUF5687 family protein [Sphingobacterium bovistauri]MCA5006635.1 hypothetical protein [Sphingobacterium bovistauri]